MSGARHLPPMIWVEVWDESRGIMRVIGSDSVFYVDRRLTLENIRARIEDKVEQISKRHGGGLTFGGYTVPGDQSGRTYQL